MRAHPGGERVRRRPRSRGHERARRGRGGRDRGRAPTADLRRRRWSPSTPTATWRCCAPTARPPRSRCATADTGETGGVFGHPGGGALEVSPFRVAEEITATGTDIYDQGSTSRDVLVLASDLEPGDSGSALVDPAGRGRRRRVRHRRRPAGRRLRAGHVRAARGAGRDLSRERRHRPLPGLARRHHAWRRCARALAGRGRRVAAEAGAGRAGTTSCRARSSWRARARWRRATRDPSPGRCPGGGR